MSATALDLITHAKANGVELWVEGGKLRYRGHPAAIETLLPELRRRKAELLTALQKASSEVGQWHPEQEAAIRRWLVYVGETDRTITAEVLANCRTHPEALAYCLERAKEIPAPAQGSHNEVAKLLNEPPNVRYVVTVDHPDSDPVLVSLGIRGVGTCRLAIPKDQYDTVWKGSSPVPKRSEPRVIRLSWRHSITGRSSSWTGRAVRRNGC